MSPMTLERCSWCTFPVTWLPTSGICLATALMTSCRKAASTEAARPSTVTRISSRGNSARKEEKARFETRTPPLSSPYFLVTPNAKAAGVERCWVASILRITRSTGFTATTASDGP